MRPMRAAPDALLPLRSLALAVTVLRRCAGARKRGELRAALRRVGGNLQASDGFERALGGTPAADESAAAVEPRRRVLSDAVEASEAVVLVLVAPEQRLLEHVV
eukprot:3122109-Rhodomonas_salina.2